jgi:hypothetical protein
MPETIADYLAEIDNALNRPAGTCVLSTWDAGKQKWKPLTEFGFGYTKGYYDKQQGFQITANGHYVTGWYMQQFPGCCAFCISTGVYVSGMFVRRGVNKIANRLRQALAKGDGYTALVCTDVDDNKAERRTLAANKWQDIFRTVNRRTGNTVNISIKMLE